MLNTIFQAKQSFLADTNNSYRPSEQREEAARRISLIKITLIRWNIYRKDTCNAKTLDIIQYKINDIKYTSLV